ncbi:MAG: aminotransferase class I/II-fold pyridoxal phosphate-dependent enzyme [Lachnospiraceae bacterium]|nr:aminotransferase class I/II-fold pyridoxal phosphate-dependent enzyme [Lachnospiraceae bacterium]
MLEHKDHFHGSDLEKIEKIYGIKKEEIVSFSANVNPLGISPRLRSELSSHITRIENYPDREYKDLRESIAEYSGADPSHIIVGNGTTELISLFIQITHPKKALILGPTYSEYEREITLEGGRTRYYPLKEDADFRLDIHHFTDKLSEDLDLVILCNPNNPTSTCISKNEMRTILDVCKENNIYVMVDETYMEFVEESEKYSSIPLAAFYNNIIILRGTSKFFAAPGLRLGYAITGNADLLKAINQYKNPWMINSLAEIAGCIMFSDKEYIKETVSLISSERERLYEMFTKSHKFKAFKPTANFMLLKILDDSLSSGALFERAIREKMMIRDCSTFPFLSDRFIRICFMNKADNDRLAECLLR